ncbi:hypothetical protein [Streptococcus sp. sy010]|nr:hypothetical protein [Streptococcus sp. sy010]
MRYYTKTDLLNHSDETKEVLQSKSQALVSHLTVSYNINYQLWPNE